MQLCLACYDFDGGIPVVGEAGFCWETPMEFELNQEQQQIRMSVREFAESEIAPHVMEWDEAQHFPIELKPKLADLGLMGVLFPEEYGGAGMGYVEYATIIEELSRVDGSVGISVAAHNSLCGNHIYKYGTEEQKRKYLVPLARGEHLGAWGLTEPGAGSDASGTKSTAVRTDGGWIVNGSKNFITHAIHADTCVAVAVTDRAKRSKGISTFIFENGMKGFSPSKKENKLGLRASETASVVFEDCFVPEENLLGDEGQGGVSRSPPWRWVLPRAHSNQPCVMPLNANSLASQSPSFRRFNLNLPTWLLRLMPQDC